MQPGTFAHTSSFDKVCRKKDLDIWVGAELQQRLDNMPQSNILYIQNVHMLHWIPFCNVILYSRFQIILVIM